MPPAEALARAVAVDRWEALYDDVRRRRAAGKSLRRINRETGLARATVRKYAFAEHFPRHGRRGPGRSILDPHLDHLHARHGEGCENARQLWRELRELGFPGTAKQVRRWLSERRTQPARTTIRRLQVPSVAAPTASTSSPPLPSPKQLSWHLLREPEDLDAEAAAAVARVLQDEEAARVVELARRFCRIVRRRCGGAQAEPGIIAAFDAWLADARACGVRVPAAACLVRVVSRTELKDRCRRETRFHVSSAALGARRAAEAVRGHWAIENSLHWVLDVTFANDQSRLRKGHGAHNMAVVRHFAINLVRTAPDRKRSPRSPLKRGPKTGATPKPTSLKLRRKMAAWDSTYMHTVLQTNAR